MFYTESPVSSKRRLALTKVKTLTQTSSEPIQLDQQIVTEHLLVRFVSLYSTCIVHIEAINIILPSLNIK